MEPVSMEGAHKAVDLQAVRGTPALSPVDGVVANVKYEPQGLGLQVQVMGRDKKLHTLAHLDKVHVAIGDRVKAGQGVAEVGDSGAGATGPHLDYRRQTQDGEYEDPTADLGGLAQMPRADKPEGWTPPDAVGAGQWTGHQAPLDPTWGTDASAIPLGDRNDLRQYYENATPTFRRNLGVPEPGTPEFERFIQAEYNAAAAEHMAPYQRNPHMPAMPSRNAIVPLGGVAGIAANFPQQFWENFLQPGARAVGEWFNPPPAYAPGLDDGTGGGQDMRDSPSERTRDTRDMDRNYRQWNDPRWGEFASDQEPQDWMQRPAADEHNAGIPAWVIELANRYNVPPEVIAPDLVDRGYDIPGAEPSYTPTQARGARRYGMGQDMPAGYKTHWDVGVGQFEGYGGDIGQFGGLSGYEDPASYGMGGYGAGPQYGSYGGGWNPYGENYDLSGGSPGGAGGPGGGWYDSFPSAPSNPSFPGPQGLGNWFDSFATPSPMAASMQAYGGVGPETPGGSGGFGGPGYNYGSNYGGSAWSVPSPPGMGGYGGGGNAYTGGPPLGAPGFSGTPSGYRDVTGSYGGRSSGGSIPQSSSRGAAPQSQPGQSGGGYGSQGRDTMPFDIPDGVYGQSKWLPGSQGTDIFMRRGSPITAKTGGQVLYATGGTGLSGGSDTIAQFDDGTVARFRHVQPGLQAGSRFSAGQTIATIGDSSMDMLNPQVAGQIGAPDGYQHLDLSINAPGHTQFSPQGGGGGDIPAAQWLQQHGYRGRVVGRTPGPQEGQMGGMGGFGGPGMGVGGFPGGGYPGFSPGGFPGSMGFGGFGRGQDVGVGADFSLLPASTSNLALIKGQGWDPSGGTAGGTGATPPGATGPADPTVPSRTPKGNPVPFSPGFPGPSNVPWTPATQATYAALVAAENNTSSPAAAYAAAAGGTPGSATSTTGGGMGGWPTIPSGWTGGGAFDPFVRPGRVQMFDRPDPTADRVPWIKNTTPPTPYSPSLEQSQQWGQAAQNMIQNAPPIQNYASGIQASYQTPSWLSAGAGGPTGGGGAATSPPLTPLQPFPTGADLSRQFLTDSHFVPSAPFPPPVGGGQDSRVLDAVPTGRGWAVPDVGVGQTPYDSFGGMGTNPYSGFSGGGGQTPPTSYDTSGGAGSLGFNAGSFGSDPGQQQNQQGQLFIGPTEAESLSQGRYGLLLNTAQLGLNQQLGYNTMLGTQGQLQQIDDQYRQYYDALQQQYAIHGNAMMQYGTQQQGNAVNLTGLQLNYDQAMARLQQEWQIHGDDNQYRNDVLALQKQTQEQANALAQNQQTQQGNQFWGNLGEQESQYVRSLEEQRNQFGQNLAFQRQNAQALDLQARDLAALQARNAGYDRQLALAQTALRNPWVQQLAGMAPAYGAPGGPGAAYAAAAGGAPVGWTGGGQDSGPGWNPVGVGADNSNPYAAWGTDPTGYGMPPTRPSGGNYNQYGTTTSQSGLGYNSGGAFQGEQGSSDIARTATQTQMPSPSNPDPRPPAAPDPGWYQGYQQAFGGSTGGNPSPYDLNNDQIVDIRDFGLWRQQSAPGNPQANPPSGTLPPAPPLTGWPTGFNGLQSGFNPAPMYTPPPTPGYTDYASFAAMDPFQRAGLRTQSELSGMPWEQYEQGLRNYWGTTGGPTTAPGTTQLAAQQYNPLQVIGQNQLAEAFGQSPDQYWKAQTRRWMPSQWSGAQVQM
jgi:hypothetical protein